MSRYRPIDVMMWGDERFRSLSPLPPCAAGLWVYLLTGPHTTSVPGLFSAGERQLAEALGWPLYSGEPGSLFPDEGGNGRGFRDCWREIADKKMAFADWRARLVYIPRAIHHNKPKSPNVVIHWRHTLAELPECALKHRAVKELRDALAAWGQPYVVAFERALTGRGTSREVTDAGDEDEEEDGAEIGLGVPGVLSAVAGDMMNAVTANLDLTIVCEHVISHLNERASTRFRPEAKATRRLIAARLKDGYSPEDLTRVIDLKCADWLGSDKMRPYLRPETLFNATKFESYLNGHAGSGKETPDVFARNRAAMRRTLEGV